MPGSPRSTPLQQGDAQAARQGGGQAAAHLQPDGGVYGWWKVPSTLFEDSAPSASLDHLKAQAAPAHPRARPEQLAGSPWPQQPASGRPAVERLPLSTSTGVRPHAARLVARDHLRRLARQEGGDVAGGEALRHAARLAAPHLLQPLPRLRPRLPSLPGADGAAAR